MKRAALIVIFLVFSMLICTSASEAFLKLFVGDEEVNLQHPLVMINGNYMIPLWVFEEHLGAEVQVNGDSIRLQFSDQTILMELNSENAQVDGRNHKLEVAPQLMHGEIIVPLRFMADQRHLSLTFVQELNGFRLTQKAPRFTGLFSGLLQGEQAEPEQPSDSPLVIYEPRQERGLREIVYQGGPQSSVFLDVSSYTGYQTYLLQEPARLVIDLYGVTGDPLPPLEVEDSVLSAIRTSRFDDNTIRVVCDLKAPTGYQVTPRAEGGLELEFNYQITALSLEEQEGGLVLRFQSSAVPELETTYLQNPLRLVLDFQNTTLMTRSFDLPVDLERVVRFRAGQHSSAIARVVLELAEPVTPLPIEEAGEGSFVLPLFPGTVAEAARQYPVLAAEDGESSAPQLLPAGDGVLSGLTIVVDPGHGGSDPGTIGYQGTFEKDVNLAVGLFLGELLSEAGAKVVYTRNSDVYVSIFRRPEIAIENKADLFISVHANAHIERGRARGTETLYRAKDPVSQLLAQLVQEELVKAITLVDRRIWGRDDLAVFNGSDIPSILVEVGFLDHPDEEVLLRAPGFQKVAAQGIFNGIVRFCLEYMR